MNRIIKKENIPFWLFTAGIMIFLTLPKLIQDGMFLDGMLYTCVSHNMANGIGTFWFPQYSPSLFSGYPYFLEHPPLVFWIQSLFFRVLGDSMYVERFYVFLTMCITALLISTLWREIYKSDEKIRELSWLPLIFWISIPTWFWSYSNNMMENTLTIFDLSAVLIIYRALESGKRQTVSMIAAGFFVFLATLSKGVPGLFPVVIPLIYWLIKSRKNLWKAVLNMTLILSVIFLIYYILFNLPQSRESLTFYLRERLLGRINQVPTTFDRLYTVKRLIAELIVPASLALILYIISKLKKYNVVNAGYFIPSFFTVTGLAASVPLILTYVQRGFYLVPSFPYFAIGISSIIAPVVLHLTTKITGKKKLFSVLTFAAFIIIAASLFYSASRIGKTQRDNEMLYDVHLIGSNLPYGTEISVNHDVAGTHVLECYFVRYYFISLHIDKPKEYLLVKKSVSREVPSEFSKIDIETKLYDVYRKR